jgi:hypothetical protein
LKHTVTRNLVALAGIALIAYADIFFRPDTVFPGMSALVPCLGSALIIGAGESGSSVVGAVLAWKPIVFVGLISYSLYLWHWPVIVVQNLGVFGPMQHGTVAFVSLLLGALSWKFVETPFRSGRLRMSGRRLFATAGSVMLVFFAASAVLVASSGLRGRFSPQAEQIASYLGKTSKDYELTRFPDCFLDPDAHFKDYRPDICLKEDPAKKKNYLLIGDSHSAVIWYALSKSLPDANILQASATPCKPFIHPVGSDVCQQLAAFIYQRFIPAHPMQGLFIAVRSRDPLIAGFSETIQWAKSHQVPVVIFGPVPEYDEALPRLLAYAVAWNKPGMPAKHRVAYTASLDAQWQNLAANTWHVPYVSLYQALCDQHGCTEFADDAHLVPVLFDEDHFSKEGALLAIHRVIERGELP